MGGVISLLILVWVVYVVVKKAKISQSGSPQRKNYAGNVSVTRNNPTVKKRPQGFTNYRPHKDLVSVSRDMGDSRNSSVLRDDRANDWLAQQLREEHRAFRVTSEMFDLKIEHASHCDAKLMEQFHRKYCDASGIDLANGKTIHKK